MDDDEKLARELQEQFNAEFETSSKKSTNEQQKDAALASELAKIDNKGKPEITTSTATISTSDAVKKQQEQLDLLMAMELQKGEYQEKPAPKPIPQTPVSYPPYVPPPAFVKHFKEDVAPPTAEAVKRITTDLKEVLTSKNSFIHVAPDEEDITHVQALIVGPPDTPYAFGFFHFDMLFPHDYPWKPPKVQIQTTDNGRTRFNPNLYSNGKVCLSILGTWSGPAWTSVQTILSTLLSIQSLMNVAPYHNEPGHETERSPGDVEKYNQCIQHETLRVAVCGMMENPTCGNLFQEMMDNWFLEKYDFYYSLCEKLKGENSLMMGVIFKGEFDGKNMDDPFGEKRGVYKYGSLQPRLKKIKEQVEARKIATSMEVSEEPQQVVETPVPVVPTPVTPTPTSQPTISPMEVEKKFDISSLNFTIPTLTSTSTTNTTSSTTNTSNTSNTTNTTSSTASTSDNSEMEVAKKLVEQLVMEAQKQLDMDEELARKLQEEIYEGDYGGSYKAPKPAFYSPYGYKAPTTPPVAKGPTVKAPSIKQLMAESQTESKEKEESVICLVCHQILKEYIILPNCQAPHIYCMSCANKLIKQGPAQNDYYGYRRNQPPNNKRGKGQTIQCVLCSAVSTIDSQIGLNGLRRKKRKMEQPTTLCATHNEEFCMFCMDCAELICFTCVAGAHGRHKTEALDVAQEKVQQEVQKQITTVEGKKAKLSTFVAEVKVRAEELKTGSSNALAETKEKFSTLRKLLDDKEKEVEEAIRRMEQTKQSTIQSEINKAQQKIEVIERSMDKVNRALSEKTPLGFLQNMEDAEEELRHSALAADPVQKKKWYTMPSVQTQKLEQILKNFKYSEKRDPYLNPYDDYGNEDEVEEENVEEV